MCDRCRTLHTGFDGVPFAIMSDPGSGVYRDWDGMAPQFTGEPIPYSGIIVEELVGHTPAVVTWSLSMCRDAYRALLSRLGTVGTLTVLAGYQSLRGTQTTLGNPGRVYEKLDGVRLQAMPVREHRVGGEVDVEATFSRPFDPVTQQGRIP